MELLSHLTNQIGFDLISLPAGLLLVFALTSTYYGNSLLSIVNPLFSGTLSIIEPMFLLLEVYLVLDMVKSLNKWIASKANNVDDDPHDLSRWEPPLARSSIAIRILIIVITIASYFAAYWIVQESRLLLKSEDHVPVQFNQAIAALVTLQLIALSTTIYKEEGVISESALVTLVASLPILIASWSYFHLSESAKQNTG